MPVKKTIKKNNVESLAEAEIIFDNIPAMIFYKDTNNNILKVNQHFAKAMGMEKKRMEGKSCWELWPEWGDKYFADDKKLIKSGKSLKGIIGPIKVSGGGVRWVKIDKILLKEKGQVKSILGFGLDITEQKEFENKIKESEAKYRRLIEGLGEHFFLYTHDVRGVFQYLSPSITGMLGYSLKEFTAHYSKYLIDNPINKEVDKYTAKSIKGIKQPPYLVEIYHKNGKIKTLQVTETPVKNEKGRVTAVEGIAHDVTDLIESQKKLKESESRFRNLFSASEDAIMILEPPTFQFTAANSATLKMFGAKTEAEFTKLGPWNVSPKKQSDGASSDKKAQEMIGRAMKEGSSFFTWEHQRLNGEVFPANVLLTRVNIGEKKVIQATVRDVTEQVKQEQALKEKIEEAEKLNKFMVGRELKMIELKGKIKELEGLIK